ncbi:MAG: thermonuclease [Gammaproteobacteria bacterium]|nr:MAG: thermonuclease [Gammaproteobacteria bacterium]
MGAVFNDCFWFVRVVGAMRCLCLSCTLFCLLVSNAWSLPPSYQAKVIRVIDGDTVVVAYRNKDIKVQLAWVEAPEEGQFYALNARGLLSQWVKGKYVTVVELNSLSDRVLARLYVNGRDVAVSLVSKGAAWVKVSSDHDISLIAFQAEAQINKRGLWQEENPEPPWVWRRRH